jgi:hypothetical protein
VELVQRVIDHLNSGFFPASSYGETESEEEEEEQEEAEEGRKATSKGEQESDGEEESDDPELNNLLRRMGDRCKERKSGLPMKEIDQFERELQTKVRERILGSQSPTPRLTSVSHHGGTRACGLCVGAVRIWAPIAFASATA